MLSCKARYRRQVFPPRLTTRMQRRAPYFIQKLLLFKSCRAASPGAVPSVLSCGCKLCALHAPFPRLPLSSSLLPRPHSPLTFVFWKVRSVAGKSEREVV